MSPDDLRELGDELYVEQLLDHYRNPRNAGTLPKADIDHDGDNPTCGDMIHVFANVKGGKVDDIRFVGKGCAISQASASILYDELRGKRLDAIARMTIKDITKLLGIELRPARVKCGDLGLVVLKEGIRGFHQRTSA